MKLIEKTWWCIFIFIVGVLGFAIVLPPEKALAATPVMFGLLLVSFALHAIR